MAHNRIFPRLLLLTIAGTMALAGCSKNEPATATAPASQPVAAAPATPAPTTAPTTAAPAGTPAIQSQDGNQAGIVADLTECKRGDGVLTVKIRFRNTGSKQLRLDVIDARNYEAFYVTGGSKKYFILKDSEGTYLTPNAGGFGNLDVKLDPGQGWLWWAKYPAPPAEVTKINLVTPITPPFEDVPISDK